MKQTLVLTGLICALALTGCADVTGGPSAHERMEASLSTDTGDVFRSNYSTVYTVAPGDPITLYYDVINNGGSQWLSRGELFPVSHTNLITNDPSLPALDVDEHDRLTVTGTAPSTEGQYVERWELLDSNGDRIALTGEHTSNGDLLIVVDVVR